MHLVAAENGSQIVAAIVLAGIILYELRAAIIALNNAERYYTAFHLCLHRPSCASQCCRGKAASKPRTSSASFATLAASLIAR
jgi:hypothetical protein